VAAEIITKGQYHDLWGIPAGGLCNPASAETIREGQHTYVCLDPDRARHEFKEIYIPVMLEAVQGALKKCGLSPSDVAYFDMVNANLKVQEIVLENLGLPIERSSAEYLKAFGHFGSQDIFFNLDMAVKEKRIQKGDYVVMLTTGIGFSWGSAVLRY
jgi:3-oxoacyl-[acyl-carrier-protein] synthase-3